LSARERLIRQLAAKYGLDPDAVVAIASVEGQRALHGGNSIGDHGTSFGGFQEHAGGALPAWVWAKGPTFANAWANSRAGLEHAVAHMAPYARGKHGRAAVAAISSGFERPRDVPGEIDKAMGYYGHVGAPGGPLASGRGSSTGPSPATVQALLSARALKSMAAATMLQQSAATAAGAPPDSSGLLARGIARRQYEQAHHFLALSGRTPPSATRAPTANGGINDLIYDPEGGIKYGKEIGAIGHHPDHVHVALSTLAAQRQAEAHARQLGLHVGEESDKDVHPVHATHSFHYRTFPGSHLRMAADVSGDPRAMAAYYRWVKTNFG
jgi:hypothetical protein